MKPFRTSEGSVIRRVAGLNPHLDSIWTVQNQHAVDRAAVIADGENSIFLRNRLPLLEQSIILLLGPLMHRGQCAEERLAKWKPILRPRGEPFVDASKQVARTNRLITEPRQKTAILGGQRHLILALDRPKLRLVHRWADDEIEALVNERKRLAHFSPPAQAGEIRVDPVQDRLHARFHRPRPRGDENSAAPFHRRGPVRRRLRPFRARQAFCPDSGAAATLLPVPEVRADPEHEEHEAAQPEEAGGRPLPADVVEKGDQPVNAPASVGPLKQGQQQEHADADGDQAEPVLQPLGKSHLPFRVVARHDPSSAMVACNRRTTSSPLRGSTVTLTPALTSRRRSIGSPAAPGLANG